MITNFTYYLSNFSNITQLSLTHSYLTEMPDLYDKYQIRTLHLDNNQIQLIDRNYSTIQYLYLTFNHIYALHQTNLSYPKLEYLDLSHNPIEYIIGNFFSNKQFPQLKILKLTNALSHINPYIIDNRLISFSSLNYLNEIDLDENHFEEFSCEQNASHIQWKLPRNLKKISFKKNKLSHFDGMCLAEILNLTELDLSANQLNLKDIQANQQYLLPSTLRILYLNSLTTDLSCLLFDNLSELEELYLENLTSIQLERCIFKRFTKLKTLNLRNHHLKIFDEKIFRSFLTINQLHTLDITSHSLLCDSCSLRWLINFLKYQNNTQVTCLNHDGTEILLNTLDLSSCPSLRIISTMIITIPILISVLLFTMFLIYTYQHRKFPFSKIRPVYHMIPLRHYDRIYQSTTADIIDDNVMLVTL